MIGIIGAMDIEIDGLKAKMGNKESRVISGIEFTSGRLGNKNVVTAVCGVGKVNAAVCAQAMILSYDLSCVINTGVAGSLTTELDVGDIAVAKDTVEHDMDTTPLGDPQGYISGLNMIKMPANAALARQLTEAARGLGIKCLSGTIASGDQFISELSQKAGLAERFGAIACEMEGAAVGHVCRMNDTPYAVVRAISDSATGKGNMEYEEFKHMAAEMSNKIVMEFLK